MNNIINIIDNIDYFKNCNEGTKIILDNKITFYKYSSKHLLNKLCLINLTNIKAYNKALSKLFNYKYLNPYCLNNITLIQIGNINNYNTIWINYNNIKIFKHIKENKTKIVFYSNNKLIVNKKINYFKKQIDKIEDVKRYLCKL